MQRSLHLVSKNIIFNWGQDKITFVSTGAFLGLATGGTISWILAHYAEHILIESFFITLFAAHFICALALIHDLFKVSKRSNKSLWAFVILTLPAANLFLYRFFMRRHKPNSGRSYLFH